MGSMTKSYIDVTAEDFNEKVLQAPQMVIVNFTTPESSTCKIQEPEFEAISKEYQDRATFARLDVTGQDELTSQWDVKGVPTLIFFKYGREMYRIPGIMMRDKLRRRIEGVLLSV